MLGPRAAPEGAGGARVTVWELTTNTLASEFRESVAPPGATTLPPGVSIADGPRENCVAALGVYPVPSSEITGGGLAPNSVKHVVSALLLLKVDALKMEQKILLTS